METVPIIINIYDGFISALDLVMMIIDDGQERMNRKVAQSRMEFPLSSCRSISGYAHFCYNLLQCKLHCAK